MVQTPEQLDRETRQRQGWAAPTDDELMAKHGTYLRENHNRDWRRAVRDRTLRARLEKAAAAARQCAQDLIRSGVWEREAWDRAERQELLGGIRD